MPDDRGTTFSPDQLSQAFTDLATPSRPDYRDDLFRRTARTRQRPAWTFIERWLPMTFVTARQATAPPLPRVWTLLIVGLMTAALMAGLAIAGSQLLRDSDPRLNAMVPVIVRGGPLEAADLSFPMGIDVGPDGDLYVVNTGTNEIVVLDQGGRELRRWGGSGTGEGQFLFQRDPSDPLNNAGGIAVGPDGSVYVADMVNDRVQRFTAEGEFVLAWGGHGPEEGLFLEPFDIAVGPDGSVYVVDDLRDDIQKFSADGEWIETIGRHGSADGELDFSGGIDVDGAGILLNADPGNQRIQAWDETGAFIWSRPTGPDPVDVSTDADGNLYVARVGLGLQYFGGDPVSSSITRLPDWEVGYVVTSDDGAVYVSNPAADRIDRLTVRYEEIDAAPESPAAQIEPDPNEATSMGDGVTASDESADGGIRVVRFGSTFPLPFSAELPSAVGDRSSGKPGWRLEAETPGYVQLEFVRNAEDYPVYVSVWLPAGVFRDPCHPEDGMLTTSDRPGVDELVEALTHQVGVRASPVTDISFGDVQGKIFDLDNTIDWTDCTDSPMLRQWTFRSQGLDGDAVEVNDSLSNTHARIAIVDVDGISVLIQAWENWARRDEVTEAYRLFESIRFE